jgi:hypothetical protein
VHALEASNLDDIILKTPLVCLKRDYGVNVLKQPSDRIIRAVLVDGDTPKNINGRETIALYRESQPHNGRALSARIKTRLQRYVAVRIVDMSITSTDAGNFWRSRELGPYGFSYPA